MISSFGQKLFEKHRHLPHRYQYIKQKMRELSRFLIIARQECASPSLNIRDCLSGQMFDSVVKAVKTACGFDSGNGRVHTPSLALKLGHNLMKCSQLLLSTAVKEGDETLRNQVKAFQTLYKSDWAGDISSHISLA